MAPSKRGAWVVLVVLAVVAGVILTVSPVERVREKAALAKSVDNVRALITRMLADDPAQGPGRFPSSSGKNFVLFVVASRKLDVRHARYRSVLFSPADPAHASLPTATEYAGVTMATLAHEGTFSRLTSYAGRRNPDPALTLRGEELEKGTPLIADFHFPDHVVVGYSSGSVEAIRRSDLGPQGLRRLQAKLSDR